MKVMGISLVGLPTTWSDQSPRNTNIVEDKRATLLEEPPSATRAEEIALAIHACLARNQATHKHFCNKPSAEVHITMPAGTKPVYVRQYPIPKRMQPHVDKQNTE